MARTFSIAEIERLTLLRRHRLRIWELRFPRFASHRKATNVRYYTIDDLAYLLDLSLLDRLGWKVSKLAIFSRDELHREVQRLDNAKAKLEHQINQLIVCTFSLNVEDFELALDCAVSFWGIDVVVESVLLPFMERLQLFSYANRKGSEYHFVVTAVRKKLIIAIEKARPEKLQQKTVLLFLPKGEHFDLLLLYHQYRLKIRGFTVLYLGTDISVENLAYVVEQKQPDYLLSYSDKPAAERAKQFSSLFGAVRQRPLYVSVPEVGGGEAHSIEGATILSFRSITECLLSPMQTAPATTQLK